MKPLDSNSTPTPEIPLGLCQCGCGGKTTVSKTNFVRLGYVKGVPRRFMAGHRGLAPDRPTLLYLLHGQEPNPSGLCMCGCGQTTPLAKDTRVADEHIKGKHVKFVFGHRFDVALAASIKPNESGLCLCGCGLKTSIAAYTSARHQCVRGKPLRFIRGHARRQNPLEYLEEDRGYKTPCWIWQRSKEKHGYGISWDFVKKKAIPAHRLFYERANGPIPEGLTVDHLCRIQSCVNATHMELVTQKINSQRAMMFRLDSEKVTRMLELQKLGVTYAELARMFGVSDQHVRNICIGKKWKSLSYGQWVEQQKSK